VASGELLCAIHQPNFFPRLSTLAKLFTADVWIVLDDVQFTRRDYQHRCRLAALDDPAAGRWLTLPVHLPGGRTTLINDARLVDPVKARRRTERLLQQYYRRAGHWPTIHTLLPDVLDTFDRTDHLALIAEQSTLAMLNALEWPGVVYRSSELAARTGRSERLADLTCAVGATTYLCGTGGARYLDQWPFATHGLETRLFTTPISDKPDLWRHARTYSALHAFASVGHDVLKQEVSLRSWTARPRNSRTGQRHLPAPHHPLAARPSPAGAAWQFRADTA
jgi:WbqC-like protein family